MRNLFFASLIFLSFLLFSSCSKSDNDDTQPTSEPTKTELLVGKSWKITGVTLNGNDVFSQMPSCNKDDIIIFSTDGTAVTDAGKIKCDPSEMQTETETWAFTQNETKLIIGGEESTLIDLTTTTLKIELINGSSKAIITHTAQ